jgi:hypothetical protein
MDNSHAGLDKISLAEIAAKAYVKKHVRSGVFPVPIDLALFFRIFELSGQPVASAYGYRESPDNDKEKEGVFVVEAFQLVGPYPGLLALSKLYGIKGEYLVSEATRKNIFMKMKPKRGADHTMEFKIEDSLISPASNYDNILRHQSKADGNYALFELLKRHELELLEEKFGRE